jgi:TolB protein
MTFPLVLRGLVQSRRPLVAAFALACAACATANIGSAPPPLGIFTSDGDVGLPSTIGAGSASYDAARKVYTITGGGENMWATADHFHYVWMKVSGDMALEADVEFIGTEPASGTPDPHRKACLVFRQSLDRDSPYADAATHGDGLTSLQWRDAPAAVTHEVQASVVRPSRLRIEKRGDYVSMYVATGNEAFHPAGGAARVPLTGDYYIGLAVSAHNPSRRETARFSRVAVNHVAPLGAATTLVSTLETISLRSKDRRVAYVVTQPQRIEAPNWYPDATNTLYFNTRGKFYRVQADVPGQPVNPNRMATPQLVDLGMLTNINNDHGLTFDGRTWAFSDQSQLVDGKRPSLVYTLPVGGATASRVTALGPSYFHGWAPDGRSVVYCAERGGNFDIYSIPVTGGTEQRLTTNPGKDDGPEYAPDGQYVYFNSDRSGTMQIWRMRPDGSGQEQITNDEWDNWFPHVSPNGQSMAFLSYERGVGDHPENKHVRLRVMTLATRATDELARLFGGQGTINVNSWAPNSQYLAFVSYQVVPAAP